MPGARLLDRIRVQSRESRVITITSKYYDGIEHYKDMEHHKDTEHYKNTKHHEVTNQEPQRYLDLAPSPVGSLQEYYKFSNTTTRLIKISFLHGPSKRSKKESELRVIETKMRVYRASNNNTPHHSIVVIMTMLSLCSENFNLATAAFVLLTAVVLTTTGLVLA